MSRTCYIVSNWDLGLNGGHIEIIFSLQCTGNYTSATLDKSHLILQTLVCDMLHGMGRAYHDNSSNNHPWTLEQVQMIRIEQLNNAGNLKPRQKLFQHSAMKRNHTNATKDVYSEPRELHRRS